jgi:hypothetical protein
MIISGNRLRERQEKQDVRGNSLRDGVEFASGDGPSFISKSNEYRAYTCRRGNRVPQISGSRAYLEVIDDDWA